MYVRMNSTVQYVCTYSYVLQGNLLSQLMPPSYLYSVAIADATTYNLQRIHRALGDRLLHAPPHTQLAFPLDEEREKTDSLDALPERYRLHHPLELCCSNSDLQRPAAPKSKGNEAPESNLAVVWNAADKLIELIDCRCVQAIFGCQKLLLPNTTVHLYKLLHCTLVKYCIELLL